MLCYVGATVGLFGHSGFQIDTEFKQQRFYLSYVGLKLGGWQPLRNYDRICVRLCRGRASNRATWRDIKNDHYKIFLFNGVQSEAVCICQTGDIDVANETAQRLKLALPAAEIVHN